jgi:hypothetical protein
VPFPATLSNHQLGFQRAGRTPPQGVGGVGECNIAIFFQLVKKKMKYSFSNYFYQTELLSRIFSRGAGGKL